MRIVWWKDSRKLKLELHKICRDEADNGAQKKDWRGGSFGVGEETE